MLLNVFLAIVITVPVSLLILRPLFVSRKELIQVHKNLVKASKNPALEQHTERISEHIERETNLLLRPFPFLRILVGYCMSFAGFLVLITTLPVTKPSTLVIFGLLAFAGMMTLVITAMAVSNADRMARDLS